MAVLPPIPSVSRATSVTPGLLRSMYAVAHVLQDSRGPGHVGPRESNRIQRVAKSWLTAEG
jgi:hypothetical protein